MLALLAREGVLARQLLPAAALTASAHVQDRGMKIFEIFSKEEREKRKARAQMNKDEKARRRAQLKEEMQRGYFDDFRDFRDSKGKVFLAPEKLAPAAHAPAFPRLEVVLSDGSPDIFPPAAAASSSNSSSSSNAAFAEPPAAASLVCVAFRAGAQPMLDAWAEPFAQHFQGRGGVALFELAVVEGVVMRMWPFKQLLLRGNAANAGKYALPVRHLHHFGDVQGLREALHLTNLLTGYVFLVDAQGRLRWRGSGSPSANEMATLLRCTEELLQQEGAGQQQLQQPGRQAAAAGT